MRYLIILCGLLASATASPSQASPITLTGAELAAIPNVSFPTGSPSLVGNNLRLDAETDSGVLFRLPLDSFNVNLSDFSVSVDLLRLLNDQGGPVQSLFVGLFDGETFFGTVFLEEFAQNISPTIRVHSLVDNGRTLEDQFFSARSIQNFSPIGSVAELEVTIQATPTQTFISTTVNQSNPFARIPPRALNLNGDLSLLLIGQSAGQNFEIGSLTFNRGVSEVVEPGALGGMALGLMAMGLGLYRRRFV